MPAVEEQSILSGSAEPLRFIPWLAGSLVIVNCLLLFPYTWWALTGVLVIPQDPLLIRHIDLDGESNLFTWYSNLLLILMAEAALVNFGLDSAAKGERSWLRYAWLGIGGVALFLSLDEVAMIHESVSMLVKQQLADSSFAIGGPEVDRRTWILAYAPGILAVICGFLFAFLRLFRSLRGPLLCGLGGLTLWISALVWEFFGDDFARVWGDKGLMLETVLEEGSEIFGTTALLVAFAWYGWERLSVVLSDRDQNNVGPS